MSALFRRLMIMLLLSDGDNGCGMDLKQWVSPFRFIILKWFCCECISGAKTLDPLGSVIWRVFVFMCLWVVKEMNDDVISA